MGAKGWETAETAVRRPKVSTSVHAGAGDTRSEHGPVLVAFEAGQLRLPERVTGERKAAVPEAWGPGLGAGASRGLEPSPLYPASFCRSEKPPGDG